MTGHIYEGLLKAEGKEKVEEVLENEMVEEDDGDIEEPLKTDTELVSTPRQTVPRPDYNEDVHLENEEEEVESNYEAEKEFEEQEIEEIEDAIDINPIKNVVSKPKKLKTHDTLVFEGDDFLTSELNPSLYASNHDTLSIPLTEKELYSTKVDTGNIEGIIKKAFELNPRRVSFSLEELGLHNRLIEMGVPQDFDDFILVRTSLGNVAVHKTATSRTDIESRFMEEARQYLLNGQRIVIPLLEQYKFRDNLDIVSKRYRYRASLYEIKNFVAMTNMKATITKDSYLVIYE